MPEETVPETTKLKDRVAKLEAAVGFLLKGAKRVNDEIGEEWGEATFESGEHFGVKFESHA